MFQHNIAFMINSIVVSLDTLFRYCVKINILQKIITVLQEKMLKAVNLY